METLTGSSIKRSIHYPVSFRSVLLLAALHFSWKTGALGQYESTYLTHKIECIRSVNILLEDQSSNIDAIRSYLSVIATLCLVETSTGNLDAAEAHLEGLMVLVDTKNIMWPANDASQDVNGVLQRYIMISIQEVFRLRNRLKPPLSSNSLLAKDDLVSVDDYTRAAVRPIGELNDRLLAIWLMPYLHLANQNLLAEDVDATEFIDYLRIITERHGGRRSSPLIKAEPSRKWVGSGAHLANYFLWGVTGNMETPHSTTSYSETFQSSWVGLSIATGFYLYGLIGLASAQHALDGRALRWIMRMLQRDIEKSYAAAIVIQSGSFWLWKVVLGALGIVGAWMAAIETGTVETSISGGQATFIELRAWFLSKIRLWSQATGILEWVGARDALSAIVWPLQPASEPLAIMIWEHALAETGL